MTFTPYWINIYLLIGLANFAIAMRPPICLEMTQVEDKQKGKANSLTLPCLNIREICLDTSLPAEFKDQLHEKWDPFNPRAQQDIWYASDLLSRGLYQQRFDIRGFEIAVINQLLNVRNHQYRMGLNYDGRSDKSVVPLKLLCAQALFKYGSDKKYINKNKELKTIVDLLAKGNKLDQVFPNPKYAPFKKFLQDYYNQETAFKRQKTIVVFWNISAYKFKIYTIPRLILRPYQEPLISILKDTSQHKQQLSTLVQNSFTGFGKNMAEDVTLTWKLKINNLLIALSNFYSTKFTTPQELQELLHPSVQLVTTQKQPFFVNLIQLLRG